MQDKYTTGPAECQGPYELDEWGRVTRKVDKDELPLTDIAPSGKARPWRKHHREGLLLSEVYAALGECCTDGAAKYLDKARRLESCAQSAEFWRLPSGELRLHRSSFCRVRLCPMCQWRRSLKLGAQVRQVVQAANAQHIAETGAAWRWVMVTYTVRNVDGPDLAAAIDTIHKGLNNMAKCKRWKGAVRGWLRATEVTHNTDTGSASYDTYHPHMHILLCVPAGYMSGKGYIRQAEWAALWQHYIKADYTPIVDVRTIKPEGGGRLADLPAGEQAAAMGKACAEVSKYAAKPADYIVPGDIGLSMSAVQTLDRMLDRRRMTAWGGILKDIAKALQLDDPETGDLVHIDDTASPDPVAEDIAQYVTYTWAVGVRDYYLTGKREGMTPAAERAAERADRAKLMQHRTQQQQADYTVDSWTVSAYKDAYSWDKGMQRKAIDDLRHMPRKQIDARLSELLGPLPDNWEDDSNGKETPKG